MDFSFDVISFSFQGSNTSSYRGQVCRWGIFGIGEGHCSGVRSSGMAWHTPVLGWTTGSPCATISHVSPLKSLNSVQSRPHVTVYSRESRLTQIHVFRSWPQTAYAMDDAKTVVGFILKTKNWKFRRHTKLYGLCFFL